MKISENECREITRVITKLNMATGVLDEYSSLMIFESEEDKVKVQKGLNILKSKMEGIDKAECYDDTKKFLKIKKIIKDFKLREMSINDECNKNRVF